MFPSPIRHVRLRASLLFSLSLLLASTAAHAQSQDVDQRKCLTGLVGDGAKVAKAQAAENAACRKLAAAGKELPGGGALACLDADPKGKVATAAAKAIETAGACATAPDFGATDGAAIAGGAETGARAVATDIFGSSLDGTLAACDADAAGCRCQASVLGAAQKAARARLDLFRKCHKSALSDGADDIADLGACLDDAGLPASVAADAKGKVAKAVEDLLAAATEDCFDAALPTATLFPGECAAAANAEVFSACVDDRVQCRTCEIARDTAGIESDCDLFDDGEADGSCVRFAGRTFYSETTGRFASVAPMTGQVASTAVFAATANEFFEITGTDPPFHLRSTGNGAWLAARSGDGTVFADAADTATATPWVFFVITAAGGPGPFTTVILRDAPPSTSVDALCVDTMTSELLLRAMSVFDVFTEPSCLFRF